MLTIMGKFFGLGYFLLNLVLDCGDNIGATFLSPIFPVPLTDPPVLSVFYSGNTQTRNIRLFPPSQEKVDLD